MTLYNVKFIQGGKCGKTAVTIRATYFNISEGFLVFYTENSNGKFDRTLAYNSTIVESVEEK